MEKNEYVLDIDEKTQKVRTYNADPREIWVMRASDSVEMSPSYVKSLERLRGRHKLLICEGFRIKTYWHNNIALLTGDRVLYCTDFTEVASPKEPGMSRFHLTGFMFNTVKPSWEGFPCSSRRIGFFKVSQLDLSEAVTVSAMDLVSKCFVFACKNVPYRQKRSLDPMPPSFAAIYKQFSKAGEGKRRNDLSDELARKAHELKHSDPSYCHDYWWIESIAIPGRFPNFYQ